jgi:hypothetical protein
MARKAVLILTLMHMCQVLSAFHVYVVWRYAGCAFDVVCWVHLQTAKLTEMQLNMDNDVHIPW